MKPRHPLNERARELRNNPTDAERALWRYLRSSQLEGVKFRRQQPIEGYIVDFVSFDRRIIIELDGGQHAEDAFRDKQRDTCLVLNGFTVMRFWNNEVFENIEGVLEVIRQRCVEAVSPTSPTPSRQGRGSLIQQTKATHK
jgi:very-short-patch-repair endonuclease